MCKELSEKTPKQLLQLYGAIIEELKRQEICKTNNAPMGDYTEWLVCKALNLNPKNNSEKGIDATDSNDIKYQIKSRRVKDEKEKRTQLSALRDMVKKEFDFLIVVVYNQDFTIKYAYQYPYSFFKGKTYDSIHTNSKIFYAEQSHIDLEEVEDLTDVLRKYHK